MAVVIVADWLVKGYSEYSKKYPDFEKLIKRGKNEVAFNFDRLALELFARLATGDYETDRNEVLKPEDGWIQALHSKLDRNLDWKLLCDNVAKARDVIGDCSMIAVNSLLNWMLEFIPAPEEPLSEDISDLRAAILELKKSVPGIDVSSMVEDGKRLKEGLEQYERDIEAVSQEEISKVCRKACEEFKMLIEDDLAEAAALSGFDLQIGQDADSKKKFAKALRESGKLKEIVKIAGKLIARADAIQDAKAEHGKHTIEDVELGDSLSRALPSEMLGVATDFLSFAKKFVTRSLSQFELGVDKKKEGAIVILLDDTGSMSGHREVWAKAVCWALISIANRQGRHCRLIHWGDGARRVDDFEPGEGDIDKWIDTMNYFYSDYVNNEPAAFDCAMECIEEVDSYSGADIVFISDGGWMAGADRDAHEHEKKWCDRFQQKMKDCNVDVYSIMINCHYHGLPNFLKEDESKVIMIGDIANDAELDRVFEAL